MSLITSEIQNQRRQYCLGLTCENIKSNKMDFGVAVFTGFGGGHLDNLAGAVLK